MAKDIDLKIYMPEKIVLNEKVYRAVLPFDDKTITVLKDRAPTLIGLDMGVIQILDENNSIIDEWLLAGGCADIHSNTCTILTEACFNKKELDLVKVKDLYKNFANPFYKWLIEFFEKEERKAIKK
ncbi:MAG: F0F1 ATP synthase subunit epsilon [Alphaproteobacteria bacterium]|nr:F0F1 ATP synthase subunit epsilon [Alphaproteobacteria bacterium]